jgi:hypothetical protein
MRLVWLILGNLEAEKYYYFHVTRTVPKPEFLWYHSGQVGGCQAARSRTQLRDCRNSQRFCVRQNADWDEFL